MGSNIDREAVYVPQAGETLVLYGEAKGKTSRWAFQMSENGIWVPGTDFHLQLKGKIIGADFTTHVDDRVARQRESINRLLEHLKVHCPKLLGHGECDQIGALAI